MSARIFSAMIFNQHDVFDQQTLKLIDHDGNCTQEMIWAKIETAAANLGYDVSAARVVSPEQSAWYPKHLFVTQDRTRMSLAPKN
jgi:hypothetical protein